jgi:RNA polymerase-binding transcription factor DksA
MNTDTLEKYKAKLKEEKELVLKELGTVGRKNPDNPEDWEATPGDTNDRSADSNRLADNIEEYENHTAILKQLEAQLVDIKRAEAKMGDGTYGICEVSGKPIPEERLNANPAARTLVEHTDEL